MSPGAAQDPEDLQGACGCWGHISSTAATKGSGGERLYGQHGIWAAAPPPGAAPQAPAASAPKVRHHKFWLSNIFKLLITHLQLLGLLCNIQIKWPAGMDQARPAPRARTARAVCGPGAPRPTPPPATHPTRCGRRIVHAPAPIAPATPFLNRNPPPPGPEIS
jgi:hypothetical protein